MPTVMSGVTAYFDLDGTLLDASSEKANRHAENEDRGGFQSALRCGPRFVGNLPGADRI